MTQQLSLPFEQPIDREAQALVERCREAAWLIEPGQGRVVAASAEGAALLALEQDRGGWLMDAAMPALTRLREIANAAMPAEASLSERLLFWTPLGARSLACEIRRAGPAEQPVLLLVTAAAPAVHRAGDPATGPAAAARTDAETLELIARRIRETAATRAPAADLEPPDDAAAEPAPTASSAPDPAGAARADVARLAHELKTPLSAIAAAAEIMRDERLGPLGSDRYRDYAADICDSARHALALIASMLRHPARGPEPPALAFAEIDVNALAERSASAMRPLFAQAGLELTTVLEPRLPHVIADAVSLRQIVLNLLTNALKFGGRGVQVEVATRYDIDGPVTVSVRDTGPGMSEASLGQAREGGPATLRGEPDGLGIGLSLVRALAEANGARVAIESAPRRGTRVEIIFGKDRVVPI
jgi:two-component system cell cycle sensor histidine kinase PleC